MSEPEEGARYEFDADFQTKIIALALRDSTFAQRTDGLVTPAYFETEVDQAIVAVAQQYYGTYRKAPDRSSLGHLFKKAIEEKRIRKDLQEPLRDRLKEILTTDIADRELVVNEVANFARQKAVEASILESVHLLGKGDFDSIVKKIRAAVDVGAAEDDGGYDYFAEIANRTTKRVDLMTGTAKPRGITTGIPELDKLLYHNGWGRKELSAFMAPAKGGKSMALHDFAVSAALAGYKVLDVTLEVSAEIIADRVDANLSDIAVKSVRNSPHAVEKAVSALAAKCTGNLRIHEYASGTFKVSALRRLLERYRSKGIVFDLIVVDYADIMCPERVGEYRDGLRQIYVDLRGVAFEQDAAVLTATQTNRDGAKTSVAKSTDIAEDWSKVMTVDLLLSINATEPERIAGEARIFFAASRNTEDGFSVRIQQDREKMKFIKKWLGREAPK